MKLKFSAASCEVWSNNINTNFDWRRDKMVINCLIYYLVKLHRRQFERLLLEAIQTLQRWLGLQVLFLMDMSVMLYD